MIPNHLCIYQFLCRCDCFSCGYGFKERLIFFLEPEVGAGKSDDQQKEGCTYTYDGMYLKSLALKPIFRFTEKIRRLGNNRKPDRVRKINRNPDKATMVAPCFSIAGSRESRITIEKPYAGICPLP